jgi:hypothetical protein
MTIMTRHSDPDHWLDQMFSAKAVAKGAVIRRSMCWVHREIGYYRFEAELRRRGYRLIRTADQYVVICHSGPIEIVF